MLRTGVFHGNPSRFPVPLLATSLTSLHRCEQRALILSGELATLHYQQLHYSRINYVDEKEQTLVTPLVVFARVYHISLHTKYDTQYTRAQ